VPFLRVDLAGPVAPELKAALLRRTAELFAEITESPVDRIRTQVHELPADSFAVGGIPIAESGVQAPFVTLDLLEGRPLEQHAALVARMSALVGELVGVPLDRVRLRINEVKTVDWGIGGVPASELRRAEIESRQLAESERNAAPDANATETSAD
jgi:4-oxalocrotonate tautomerase family enzyme